MPKNRKNKCKKKSFEVPEKGHQVGKHASTSRENFNPPIRKHSMPTSNLDGNQGLNRKLDSVTEQKSHLPTSSVWGKQTIFQKSSSEIGLQKTNVVNLMSNPCKIDNQNSNENIWKAEFPSPSVNESNFEEVNREANKETSKFNSKSSQISNKLANLKFEKGNERLQEKGADVEPGENSRMSSDLHDTNENRSLIETTDKVASSSKKFSKASSLNNSEKCMDLILRPDNGGRLGREVQLHVNHFEVKLSATIKKAVQYDVEILAQGKTVILPKLLRWQIFKNFVEENPNVFLFECRKLLPTYDGNKNMYTAAKLNLDSYEELVKIKENDGKERCFTIQIKYADIIDMDFTKCIDLKQNDFAIYDALRVLDTALKNKSWKQSIYSNRHMFNSNLPKIKIPGGVDIWTGHQASFRPCWKITLNLDLSFKAFYREQEVLELLKSTLRLKEIPMKLKDDQLKQFNYVMGGLKITTNHLQYKRKHVVKRIVKDTAENFKFNHNGNHITIKQYFKTEYNKELRYASLPLIEVGQKGNRIPLELCTVIEQKNDHKLTSHQQQAMIRASAIKPSDRMRKIKEMMEERQFSHDEYLAEFGVSVSNNMMNVKGRVLPPPFVNEIQSKTGDGKFNFNKVRRFTVPVKMPRFCIVLPRESYIAENVAGKFFNDLFEIALEKGLIYNHSNYDFIKIDNLHDIKKLIDGINITEFGLIFWILPFKNDTEWYRKIKYFCDGRFLTQCMKESLVKEYRNDALQNIVLKLNLKLGGTSTSVRMDDVNLKRISEEKIMLLGADVTHPAPSAKHLPSYAGVVGSLNKQFSQYGGLLHCQESKKEIIEDLDKMVAKLLKKYAESSKIGGPSAFPKKIIYYRDGVSEGQFQQVLVYELDAIQKACMSINKTYTPAITVITVQKRHHTRLFPKEGEGAGRAGNIHAGTVLDEEIVHPFNFDFFLCSHEGIQGTSRPAHYYVLYDDSNFSSDFIQLFTYHICYTYARCTRSVSYPPPTYYSHHLCMRARYYQDEYLNSINYESSQSSGDSNVSIEKVMTDMKAILEKKNESLCKDQLMYFM